MKSVKSRLPIEADSPTGVLDLLRTQAALYRKLETLANRQRTLVVSEEAGPLLALLADRRRLAQGLTEIAGKLEPVRRDWAAFRQRFSPEDQAEADRLVLETSETLQRVIQRDEQDAHVLSGRKESVAAALRSTHRTSEAVSAYRFDAGRTGRLDCMSDGEQVRA